MYSSGSIHILLRCNRHSTSVNRTGIMDILSIQYNGIGGHHTLIVYIRICIAYNRPTADETSHSIQTLGGLFC